MPPETADFQRDANTPRLEIDERGVARAFFPPERKKRRLEQHISTNTQRLVIDQYGHARVVLPSQMNKRRLAKGGKGVGPRLVIDENGRAKVDLTQKRLRPSYGRQPIHLRVGRHRESYLRTKLVEPEDGKVLNLFEMDEKLLILRVALCRSSRYR